MATKPTTTDKPSKTARPRPQSVQQGAPEVTSASIWKKKATQGTPLVVPSGNTCLARSPGMQVFLKEGLIPNSLMPMIQEAMSKGKVPDTDKSFEDPKMITDMMALIDAVTVYCVIEPPVQAVPVDDGGNEIPLGDDQRDEDILYVDEVDETDKMFIFQFAVGGTADVAKFRDESRQELGALSTG